MPREKKKGKRKNAVCLQANLHTGKEPEIASKQASLIEVVINRKECFFPS